MGQNLEAHYMKTVQDILESEAGEVITAVRGKLLNIKERKSGTNAKGNWAVQQGELMDATGKVKLKAWNHPDLSHLNGREVEIRAHKSEKHGWSGAVASDDSYTPKDSQVPVVTRELKVTATGLITPLNGAGPVAAFAPQVATRTLPVNQTQPSDPVDACVEHLGKAANGMRLCLSTANFIRNSWRERVNIELSPDQFQAITSTLFINLDKSGLIQSLPSAPIENKP